MPWSLWLSKSLWSSCWSSSTSYRPCLCYVISLRGHKSIMLTYSRPKNLIWFYWMNMEGGYEISFSEKVHYFKCKVYFGMQFFLQEFFKRLSVNVKCHGAAECKFCGISSVFLKFDQLYLSRTTEFISHGLTSIFLWLSENLCNCRENVLCHLFTVTFVESGGLDARAAGVV